VGAITDPLNPQSIMLASEAVGVIAGLKLASHYSLYNIISKNIKK
jgi:hypothetical protein